MTMDQRETDLYELDEISWTSAHGFKIIWMDGHESRYLLDFLRLNCPCAACQGHGAQHYRSLPEGAQEKPVEALPAVHVEPVGNYAMGIRFSDGHDTGIFSYRFLRDYCPCEGCRQEANNDGSDLKIEER